MLALHVDWILDSSSMALIRFLPGTVDFDLPNALLPSESTDPYVFWPSGEGSTFAFFDPKIWPVTSKSPVVKYLKSDSSMQTYVSVKMPCSPVTWRFETVQTCKVDDIVASNVMCKNEMKQKGWYMLKPNPTPCRPNLLKMVRPSNRMEELYKLLDNPNGDALTCAVLTVASDAWRTELHTEETRDPLCVRATRPIEKGEFLAFYNVGGVTYADDPELDEACDRIGYEYWADHEMFIAAKESRVRVIGNPLVALAALANHSDDANAELVSLAYYYGVYDGKKEVTLYIAMQAKRAIKRREEVTINYGGEFFANLPDTRGRRERMRAIIRDSSAEFPMTRPPYAWRFHIHDAATTDDLDPMSDDNDAPPPPSKRVRFCDEPCVIEFTPEREKVLCVFDWTTMGEKVFVVSSTRDGDVGYVDEYDPADVTCHDRRRA
jgi:hypothetical protein